MMLIWASNPMILRVISLLKPPTTAIESIITKKAMATPAMATIMAGENFRFLPSLSERRLLINELTDIFILIQKPTCATVIRNKATNI